MVVLLIPTWVSMLSVKKNPQSNGKNKTTVVVVQKKKKNNNKKKNKKKTKLTFPREIADYAHLLLDPCNGPLTRAVGAIHPGAVTERLRNTFSSWPATVTLTSSNTNGYVVWFPTFHNEGATPAGVRAGVSQPGNLFFYTNASAGAPLNSVTSPAGSSVSGLTLGANETGVFARDPAYQQISTISPFVRATTLSACLQMDFLGSLSSIAGQVAVVRNYSLASFITNTNGAGQIPTFPSVDDIFGHSAERHRLHPDGVEVIWRPTDASSLPRTRGAQNAGSVDTDPVVDAAFWCGSPTVDYTRVCAVNPSEIFGICIAWKGVPTSQLSFNCVKVVDLELAARDGQIEEIRTGQISNLSKTSIDSVTNILDTAVPGWQSKAYKGASDMMSHFGTGVGRAVVDKVTPLLRNVYSGGEPYSARRGLRALEL